MIPKITHQTSPIAVVCDMKMSGLREILESFDIKVPKVKSEAKELALKALESKVEALVQQKAQEEQERLLQVEEDWKKTHVLKFIQKVSQMFFKERKKSRQFLQNIERDLQKGGWKGIHQAISWINPNQIALESHKYRKITYVLKVLNDKSYTFKEVLKVLNDFVDLRKDYVVPHMDRGDHGLVAEYLAKSEVRKVVCQVLLDWDKFDNAEDKEEFLSKYRAYFC